MGICHVHVVTFILQILRDSIRPKVIVRNVEFEPMAFIVCIGSLLDANAACVTLSKVFAIDGFYVEQAISNVHGLLSHSTLHGYCPQVMVGVGYGERCTEVDS